MNSKLYSCGIGEEDAGGSAEVKVQLAQTSQRLHTLARNSPSWLWTCRVALSLLLPSNTMVTSSVADSCRNTSSPFLNYYYFFLMNHQQAWKLQRYLNAGGPVADVREALRGSDVIHQQERLGSMENLPGDAVKPWMGQQQCLQTGDATTSDCVTVSETMRIFANSRRKSFLRHSTAQ